MDLAWRGFELHPETPEGGMELRELFRGANVDALHERLLAFAESLGVTDLAPPTRIPNTRRALALSELAREQGVLRPFRDRVMQAHWREGRNIEDEETLVALAREVGLDEGEARAAQTDPARRAAIDEVRREASAIGVTGIPTFIFDWKTAVVGCQPFEVLARAAEEAGAVRRA